MCPRRLILLLVKTKCELCLNKKLWNTDKQSVNEKRHTLYDWSSLRGFTCAISPVIAISILPSQYLVHLLTLSYPTRVYWLMSQTGVYWFQSGFSGVCISSSNVSTVASRMGLYDSVRFAHATRLPEQTMNCNSSKSAVRHPERKSLVWSYHLSDSSPFM